MDKKGDTENQKHFVEAKKSQGLKRVILWARPEDVEALKTIARQPHSIAKLRKKVERELVQKMKPEIKAKVAMQLGQKTRSSPSSARLKQPAGVPHHKTLVLHLQQFATP